MTDRINYLTVALDRNVRDDDAQPLIDAIMQFRGVLSVEANVVDPSDWIAEQRARGELERAVLSVIRPSDR